MVKGRSSGKGLAVFALILGATGLILGGHAWLTTFIISPQGQQWYDESLDNFKTDPAGDYLTIDDLKISFTVRDGESVYFNYNGRCYIRLPAGSNSYVQIFFLLDGKRINEPYIVVNPHDNPSIDKFSLSVSLQLYRSDLTVGEHTLQMQVYGNNPANYVGDNTLFVQTFPK